MDCRDIKRYTSAYLDGELPPALSDAFFDHLQACKPCCDFVGERTFDEALCASVMKVRMTAPASLQFNVLSAISSEKARPVAVPAWRRFAWRPATAMAAMLALAGVSWKSFNAGSEPAGPVVNVSKPVRVATVPALKAPRPAASRPTPAAAPRKPMPPKEPAPSPDKPVEPVPPKPDGPPALPTMTPTRVAELPVGTITDIRTPNSEANGRFLSRVDAGHAWRDAASDVAARTHMRTAEDTIVTLQLRDGTVIKSNAQTEFVVQRSPTKDDPAWQIRLVRGEMWVKSLADIDIEAPNMGARTAKGEFGVRCLDGQDSSVVVMDGLVACRNPLGTTLVAPSQACAAVAGEAPGEAFAVADPRGQMDWVYAPTPAHNPQNDGGTQA